MRVALIIGGASGMGMASCHALAAAGFRVAVADLAAAGAREVCGELQGDGHAAFSVDVCDEDQVTRLFEEVESSMGPVAVLVTAAGTAGYLDGKRPTFRTSSLEIWNRTMAINATGTFLAMREMMRRRAEEPIPNARIVTISSMAPFTGGGTNSPPAYIASKGAVLAITKSASFEAGKYGMTVNTVAPGLVDTPMLRAVMAPERDAEYLARAPIPRAGLPQEIAAAVAFLASEGASYITGACLDVNGGYYMR